MLNQESPALGNGGNVNEPVPTRPDLRARLIREFDGLPSEFIHPSEFGGYDVDSAAAADIALAVVEPVQAQLRASVENLRGDFRRVREQRNEARAQLSQQASDNVALRNVVRWLERDVAHLRAEAASLSEGTVNTIPDDALARLSAVILADEEDQVDAVDGQVQRVSSEFRAGYLAGTKRAAQVVREEPGGWRGSWPTAPSTVPSDWARQIYDGVVSRYGRTDQAATLAEELADLVRSWLAPSATDPQPQACSKLLQPLEQTQPSDTCWACSKPGIQYQPFSGGREYFCPTCEDTFPYREGQAPRRAQMLQDGRFEELKAEMAEHLAAAVPVPVDEPATPTTTGADPSLTALRVFRGVLDVPPWAWFETSPGLFTYQTSREDAASDAAANHGRSTNLTLEQARHSNFGALVEVAAPQASSTPTPSPVTPEEA